jgi:hypothetical protein
LGQQPIRQIHFREIMMKTAFAVLLLASFGLSGAALAETGAAGVPACDPSATTGQASDDCMALRVAFMESVSACMTQRKAAADRALGSTLSNGPHTNRARYLLCSAEVRDGMGIAAK